MNKTVIDKDTFIQLSKQILQAENLTKLKEIGLYLFNFSNGKLKSSLIQIYLERKKELIQEMANTSNNKVFVALYKIITRATKYSAIVPVVDLLYVLKNGEEIKLSSDELSALFDVYKRKKNVLKMLEKEQNEKNKFTEDKFEVHDFDDDLI